MTQLINLEQYQLIKVVGDQAKKFLQSQLSCDINECKQGLAPLGAYCNVKGRVIALVRVFLFADEYYLLVNREISAKLITTLNKFALFSKVTLLAEDLKLACLGFISNDTEQSTLTIPEAINGTRKENNNLLIRLGSNHGMLLTQDPSQSASNTEVKAWQLLALKTKIAEIYPITSECFTPHHLNYPELGIINFKKGCFPGQEVIARIHYRGAVKEHCHLFTTTHSAVKPGEEITATDKIAGTVLMAAPGLNNKHGLAVIKDQFLTQQLMVENQAIHLLP